VILFKLEQPVTSDW